MQAQAVVSFAKPRRRPAVLSCAAQQISARPRNCGGGRFCFTEMRRASAGMDVRPAGRGAHTDPAGAYMPSSTTWALMRLVVPERPRGTPAVMTTVSPGWTARSLRATSTARENMRSVESTSPER